MFCKYCGKRLKPHNGNCIMCGHEMDRLEGCRRVVEATQNENRTEWGNNGKTIELFPEMGNETQEITSPFVDMVNDMQNGSENDTENDTEYDTENDTEDSNPKWFSYGRYALIVVGAIVVGFFIGYAMNNGEHKKKDNYFIEDVSGMETTTKQGIITQNETTKECEMNPSEESTEQEIDTCDETTTEQGIITQDETTKECEMNPSEESTEQEIDTCDETTTEQGIITQNETTKECEMNPSEESIEQEIDTCDETTTEQEMSTQEE